MVDSSDAYDKSPNPKPTTQAQRRCLQDCYSGLLQSVVGARVIASTKPQAVFRGRALVLEEPVEPSEVIWQVGSGCVTGVEVCMHAFASFPHTHLPT